MGSPRWSEACFKEDEEWGCLSEVLGGCIYWWFVEVFVS
jgi:hypothetical protein